MLLNNIYKLKKKTQLANVTVFLGGAYGGGGDDGSSPRLDIG